MLVKFRRTVQQAEIDQIEQAIKKQQEEDDKKATLQKAGKQQRGFTA